jgi:hypothetical protein
LSLADDATETADGHAGKTIFTSKRRLQICSKNIMFKSGERVRMSPPNETLDAISAAVAARDFVFSLAPGSQRPKLQQRRWTQLFFAQQFQSFEFVEPQFQFTEPQLQLRRQFEQRLQS